MPPSANDINVTRTKDENNYIQIPSVINMGEISKSFLGFKVEVINYPDCNPLQVTPVLRHLHLPGADIQVISSDNGEVSVDLSDFSIRYKVPENESQLCITCQIRELIDNFQSQSDGFESITSNVTITIDTSTVPPATPVLTPANDSGTSNLSITITVQYDNEVKERHYSVFPISDRKVAC